MQGRGRRVRPATSRLRCYVRKIFPTAGPLTGFLIGIAISIALAYLLYRGALKLNLGKLFTVTGVLLVFVAAGILGYGVHDLQEADVLPGLDLLAFDLGQVVPETSWFGALLKGIFNYSALTTVFQAAVWAAYVAIVLAVFMRAARSTSPVPSTAGSASAA